MKHAEKIAIMLVTRPRPKNFNTRVFSFAIVSTASSIDPSRPRKAFPDPQIDVIVASDTQAKFAQIEIIEERWSEAIRKENRKLSGYLNSIKHVVVNPANIAALLLMEWIFETCRLSSFSRNLMALCRRFTSKSDLSADNIVYSRTAISGRMSCMPLAELLSADE